MLQNTSEEHKAQANPTFDSGRRYESTTSYDRYTKSFLQPPLTLVNTPHTAGHRHSPSPSPTHYHTPPPTQYLTIPQTTVPLYPNPPPLHAFPYTTSSSSTPTQSLHSPLTSALTPRTHYPSFSPIVIPPQSHTTHLNTQDGYANNTRGPNCERP